jgi:hypothetical protein
VYTDTILFKLYPRSETSQHGKLRPNKHDTVGLTVFIGYFGMLCRIPVTFQMGL